MCKWRIKGTEARTRQTINLMVCRIQTIKIISSIRPGFEVNPSVFPDRRSNINRSSAQQLFPLPGRRGKLQQADSGICHCNRYHFILIRKRQFFNKSIARHLKSKQFFTIFKLYQYKLILSVDRSPWNSSHLSVFIHRRREITLSGSDTFYTSLFQIITLQHGIILMCPAKTGNDFCPVYLPVTVVETAIDTADITQPFLFPMNDCHQRIDIFQSRLHGNHRRIIDRTGIPVRSIIFFIGRMIGWNKTASILLFPFLPQIIESILIKPFKAASRIMFERTLKENITDIATGRFIPNIGSIPLSCIGSEIITQRVIRTGIILVRTQ